MLPEWPRYDGKDRLTMKLDVVSAVERDPGGQLGTCWIAYRSTNIESLRFSHTPLRNHAGTMSQRFACLLLA